MVSDLTKRSEWALMEFLVKLRNDVITSISVADPRKLPDYHFRGFGFLAILYWCVEYSCEGPEPVFEDSPYLARYKKAKNPIKVLLTAGLSEFLELGGLFFDLVTSAVEESVEERIKKNLNALARSKLPIGDGPASEIRDKLSNREVVSSEAIREALTKEFCHGFAQLSAAFPERTFLGFVDAVDILASGSVTRAGIQFRDEFAEVFVSFESQENAKVLMGGRGQDQEMISELFPSDWMVHRLKSITVEELLKSLRTVLPAKQYDSIQAFGANRHPDSKIDLLEFADHWDQMQRGPSDELV
ncbi:hypothetical protein AN191_00855 [Loktanella sp. 5RATIMAR09]|uniref:hypothetical protein n=1 Tax=Loktanella sp. 5RATIMAR09 TaxID=1225655 RepID=UPI00070829ED|nr:hypothetical protein [Loktanella sp. 5RATIMAR09]KQI73478.1 hypothetical protein AN191_00855 [Loktanella sp. 5RATIMAR09]